MRFRGTILFTGGLAIGVMLGYQLGWSDPRNYVMSDTQSQFSEAAGRGDLNEMKRLYSDGAKINAFPVGGFPAIETAAIHGRSDAVQWLIDRGADVNLASFDTPLDCAESHRGEAQETVEILKLHGAKHYREK